MKSFLFIMIILIGCKSNEKPTPKKEISMQDNPQFEVDSLTKEADKFASLMKKAHDSMARVEALKPPTKYELATFEKMRNIHSGAQFLRKYFMLGNLSSQLQRVQGFPDDKVDMGDYTEVWFYGNCEVTIYNGLVTKVENREECLSYIDIGICLLCADRIVGANAQKVIEDLASAKQLR